MNTIVSINPTINDDIFFYCLLSWRSGFSFSIRLKFVERL